MPFLGSEVIDLDDIGPDTFLIHPDGKVTCCYCSKTLSTLSAGRRHYVNSHQPTETATCELCQRTYKNLQTVKAHKKRDHNISQKMAKHMMPWLNNE